MRHSVELRCVLNVVVFVVVQIDHDRRLMIIVNRSIEHPQVPTTEQYVRVETYSSEMVIRPHSSFDEVLSAC